MYPTGTYRRWIRAHAAGGADGIARVKAWRTMWAARGRRVW